MVGVSFVSEKSTIVKPDGSDRYTFLNTSLGPLSPVYPSFYSRQNEGSSREPFENDKSMTLALSAATSDPRPVSLALAFIQPPLQRAGTAIKGVLEWLHSKMTGHP